MKNRKNLLLVAASLLSVAGLSSCGSKVSPDRVKLLNFKPEIADNFGNIISEFKKDTGLDLVVETAAEGQYESTLRNQIGTSDAPTIFQINGPVGYKSWQTYCSDMTSDPIYQKLTDKSLACTVDGKVVGIPTTVEGYGIVYNKAITDKYFALEKGSADGQRATINAKYGDQAEVASMDDVDSYETLKAVVEDMQKLKGTLGIDGVFAPSGMDGSTSWRITGHTFNMPLVGELGDATETPENFNFTYADNFKNLLDLYVKNTTINNTQLVASKWVGEASSFADGKCVMVQNGQWATSDLTNKGESTAAKAEDLRYLPLYSGDYGETIKEETQGLCVGTEAYWTINSKATDAQKKNASTFLSWLFDGNGKKYATSDMGLNAPFAGFNTEDLSDPLVKQVFNVWLKKENKKSVKWDFPLVPQTDNQRSALVTDLTKYYNGNFQQADWDTLVTNVKAKWTELASA